MWAFWRTKLPCPQIIRQYGNRKRSALSVKMGASSTFLYRGNGIVQRVCEFSNLIIWDATPHWPFLPRLPAFMKMWLQKVDNILDWQKV